MHPLTHKFSGRAKIFFAGALALGLVALAWKGNSAESPGHLFGLQVQEGRFLDDAGRQVILRGVNAGGRSKLPPFYPFDPQPDFETALARYADGIASLGFNVVRLLIIYEAVEPVRGRYDENYLARYDRMVEAFGKRGLYVIVDSHQDLFSRRLCGDGFPDWALPEEYRGLPQHADCKLWSLKYFTKPVAGTFDRFWSDQDQVQESYAAFFGMLAKRFREEPAVIGFEPVNEPFPGFWGMTHYAAWNRDQLFGLYQKVGEAVHAVDGRYLILADLCPLENQGAWNTSRPRPEVKNLVLAPHYYDPGTFGISISRGGDRWLMRRGLRRDGQLGKAWQAPVLVTEYGISPLFPDAPRYLNKLYSVFDELLLSGTFWEASMSATIWNEENTSLFEPDGSSRPGTPYLDRPYPRAVAGIISRFSYEPESGRLELRWTEDPQISEPTEIYLPARAYGQNPQVELNPGGNFSFDPGTRTLTIAPLHSGSQRELVVTSGARH